MKTLTLVGGLFLFAVTSLTVTAGFKSAQLLPDNPQPQFPGALLFEGITRGRAVIAVSIDSTGRVRDSLPLAYSNHRFARSSQDALRDWRFVPASFDGQPVPVQMELSFDYTVEGAVITSNITSHYLFDAFDAMGDNALVYRPGAAARIDRTPVRVSGTAPKYATAAARDGVKGEVRVRFYIDEKGDVRQPAVTADANPYLADQALEAVRGWKFEPVTSGGEPVLVIAEQSFNFSDKR